MGLVLDIGHIYRILSKIKGNKLIARPLRIEYKGAFYHVTGRGNERKKIYYSNSDYKKFKSLLKGAQIKKKVRYIVIEVSNVKNCTLSFYIKILIQKRGFLKVL